MDQSLNLSFYVAPMGSFLNKNLLGYAQLIPDNWDDYSYKTLFKLHYIDLKGRHVDLGSVKIGFKGQTIGRTRDAIHSPFQTLPSHWFSVGQDVEYYEAVHRELSSEEQSAILGGLRDVAFIDEALSAALNEPVFDTSLLRNVSEGLIKSQFRRVLNGAAALTDFKFSYVDQGNEQRSPVDLQFDVNAGSKPSTNVHVLIGRNGVGKTTILNGMVKAVHADYSEQRSGKFVGRQLFSVGQDLPLDYFGSVVSVSFSAFDPFIPPADNMEPTKGPKYFYIGMKRGRYSQAVKSPTELKSEEDLEQEFILSLRQCISQDAKTRRWQKAIEQLSSDKNFAAMNLPSLVELARQGGQEPHDAISKLLKRMSSGHKVVLLTITALVNLVEEKTLVLLDEPESHLHPPLLAAFTRTLSELLHDRNGLAVVATHSPVVLQEVPASCVWILDRSGREWRKDRPTRETFGENVGILTKEVFGLEVAKSGFHALLQAAVNEGSSSEEIVRSFKSALGIEGLSILMGMVATREASRTETDL